MFGTRRRRNLPVFLVSPPSLIEKTIDYRALFSEHLDCFFISADCCFRSLNLLKSIVYLTLMHDIESFEINLIRSLHITWQLIIS